AKRWAWVKKGAPLILEVGPRDAAASQVTVLRRHRLWNAAGKPDFHGIALVEFLAAAADELACIQRELHDEAYLNTQQNIRRDVADLTALTALFAEESAFTGWAELAWSRPTGAALEEIEARLKALKLTIRNTPLDGTAVSGACAFTGEPAVERIYVARAY
ncbi:MAG: proline--tRNA ligase, partial [Novosphingobium sp.]